jgi:hypothetical protein
MKVVVLLSRVCGERQNIGRDVDSQLTDDFIIIIIIIIIIIVIIENAYQSNIASIIHI